MRLFRFGSYTAPLARDGASDLLFGIHAYAYVYYMLMLTCVAFCCLRLYRDNAGSEGDASSYAGSGGGGSGGGGATSGEEATSQYRHASYRASFGKKGTRGRSIKKAPNAAGGGGGAGAGTGASGGSRPRSQHLSVRSVSAGVGAHPSQDASRLIFSGMYSGVPDI